jgi:hypothetical protein
MAKRHKRIAGSGTFWQMGLERTPLCYYISLAVVARQSVEASLDRGINTDLSEVWTSDNRNHADGRVPIFL